MNPVIAKERERVKDIRSMFKKHGGSEAMASKAIADGLDEGEAAKLLLKDMGSNVEPVSQVGGFNIQVGENREISGIQAALDIHAGIEHPERGNPYRGKTLIELAEAHLNQGGTNTAGRTKYEIARMATHSTSDFPLILGDTCRKAMKKGFDVAKPTWKPFVTEAEVTDFEVHTRAGLLDFSDIDLVPEGDEYTYGTLGEEGETVQVAKYGKKFSITWEAMINDDMSMFSRILPRMGAAARNKESALVYSVFTGNPTMSDNKALFHIDHKNLVTGAATPWYLVATPNTYDTIEVTYLEGEKEPQLFQEETSDVDGIEFKVRHVVAASPLEYRTLLKSSATLNADNVKLAYIQMRKQKLNDEFLDIMPAFLVCGSDDAFTAAQLFKSAAEIGAPNSGQVNVLQGLVQVISDQRLNV